MAALLLLPAIACGDDDDGDGATASPQGSGGTTVTSSATPEATAAPTASGIVVAFDTFESTAHQYAIDYPLGWTTERGGEDDTLTSLDGATYVLIEFGAGPDIEGDDPALEAQVIEAVLGHYNGEATVVGVQDFGDFKGLTVDWELDDAYWMQTWIPNGDDSWYITMTTPLETKEANRIVFQQMLDSFQTE